ncbi:ParB/RepB/Spo0J family partition protein [Campylobacter sp. LMG 7929]|uniref:ParB/RepB/Spo0J family partition protein n=1 Tax=unclassified Campylobacter TaxID=2593542 RepID=UPI001815817D|nr:MULTISPECIES: ParB/RepB/Spo0J family partition protein [unclassified Campylobacter]EAH6868633.1 ParB/RepB/Spo0J family partition protein [Campylobacter lari]MCR8697737.1 ParB/RepB/Spo0J family partition protein [Campylobacter sp. LMG 7929]MCV3396188.1 ParB/RepB/Spo0J family partition protein [Campylobacter sp. RKI_CA19_01116]MCV3471261.1 ParB/RepB/Spo0J family partition protein [Campylobacter sp. CNRCH_2015_0338h]HEC1726942.1 ParB/RepB/Spo0J family partition protein [Campylobacter lari]
MAKKSALGRGLSSILADIDEVYEKELGSNEGRIEEIDIDLISPNPYQPRKNFDTQALEELAGSIKEYGLIQPVVVFKKDEFDYILIAGERRFRACKLLEKEQIKAVVLNVDDIKLRELALIENIQRENLNPIELAHSYKELLEIHDITQEKLADLIHKSRPQIANTLRLLNLNEQTQNFIIEGKISQGHAKVLVGLEKEEEKMIVDTIIGQKLNVRDTEKLIKNFKNTNQLEKNTTLNKQYQTIINLKEKIESLGLKVNAKDLKITINFENEDEVREFLKTLN